MMKYIQARRKHETRALQNISLMQIRKKNRKAWIRTWHFRIAIPTPEPLR